MRGSHDAHGDTWRRGRSAPSRLPLHERSVLRDDCNLHRKAVAVLQHRRIQRFNAGASVATAIDQQTDKREFFKKVVEVVTALWYNVRRFTLSGESSSIGRASDCDSEGCGIVPRLLPQFTMDVF